MTSFIPCPQFCQAVNCERHEFKFNYYYLHIKNDSSCFCRSSRYEVEIYANHSCQYLSPNNSNIKILMLKRKYGIK
jgi:hypothetical protein